MSQSDIVSEIKKHREILMYILFGAATTFVSLVTYFLLARFVFDTDNALQLQLTNIISWILSVLFAFVTNKIFVFKSKASFLLEIIKFYVARLGTLLIDMLLMYLLVTLCDVNDMLSKTFVQVIVIVLNYIFGKKLVFSKEKFK